MERERTSHDSIRLKMQLREPPDHNTTSFTVRSKLKGPLTHAEAPCQISSIATAMQCKSAMQNPSGAGKLEVQAKVGDYTALRDRRLLLHLVSQCPRILLTKWSGHIFKLHIGLAEMQVHCTHDTNAPAAIASVRLQFAILIMNQHTQD